ncbi:MAG: LmeA family phospholipid-binding protein [Chloroflexi bacterium]|nr:LmeA family phospholipid-binding protein [Chloroflexota bacterium]
MNTYRKIVITITLLALLALAVVPAFAQSATVTWTEEDINSSYRVTNPARRSVTNVSVDLQPEQVVVNATVTLRGKTPVDVVTTLTPSISNGRIFWTVTAVTKDGQPVSQDILNQINASITSSWRHYVKEHGRPGRVTAIEITDDTVTITYSRSR